MSKYIADWTVVEEITSYHPTEKGWYIKSESQEIYLSSDGQGNKIASIKNDYPFMTEKLTLSCLKRYLENG